MVYSAICISYNYKLFILLKIFSWSRCRQTNCHKRGSTSNVLIVNTKDLKKYIIFFEQGTDSKDDINTNKKELI